MLRGTKGASIVLVFIVNDKDLVYSSDILIVHLKSIILFSFNYCFANTVIHWCRLAGILHVSVSVRDLLSSIVQVCMCLSVYAMNAL